MQGTTPKAASIVSKAEAGLCPALPNENETNKYFRQDGSWANVIDVIYPVGAIFMSANQTSPSVLFPGTYWKRLKDQMLMAAGDTYSAGATGGAASASYTPAGTVGEHTLTTAEMPAHTHAFTGSAVTSGKESQGHTHSVGAHSHGLNSHKHSVGAHAHGLNAHTHTGPSHTHTGPSHTHTGPSHSHTLNSHTHEVVCMAAPSNPLAIQAGSDHAGQQVRQLYAGSTAITQSTKAATTANLSRIMTGGSGSQTTSNSGTGATGAAGTGATGAGGTGATGAASGNTANSAAFDSGAASGSTANSAAFNSGGISDDHTHSVTAAGTNASTGGGGSHNHGFTGTAATINTLPPYLAVYMWMRVATAAEIA